MKLECKKSPLTSLKIFKPQSSLSMMSFSQSDDEPTIMMQANRDSNQNKNTQQNFINQNSQLNTPKLTTYESNLIESSPQRSIPSERDGEFVCKYLTPIKKQQFQKMLFKDGVIESPGKKTKPKYQSLKQNKKKAQSSKQTNILQNTNSNFNCHNIKSCEMVQSFFPYDTFNNNNKQPQCLKYLDGKLQKACSCQISNNRNTNQHTGIFVDPYSQINFLKLNNHDLFAKLQKEIEKNNKLEEEIDKIRQQNKKIVSENTESQRKIKDLQKILAKYETQRGNYLAKQWQQFHLVKEMLIEKKRSKSKTLFQKTQKQSKPQTLIDLSKVSILNVKNMDSASTIGTNHPNNYKSSALQVHTANYQLKNPYEPMKERKPSCFQIKSRTNKSDKQDEKIERFLKDKLSIVMSSKDSQQNKVKNLQSSKTQNKQNFLNENRKRSKTSKSKKSIS